jgi:RNA polymerase sigma-70 factor (ECF subfamily)
MSVRCLLWEAPRVMDLYLMADGETANMSKPAATDEARREALHWFDELRDPLRRYLMCTGASPADADEALQESFLRLYQYLEKRGRLANVPAWIFQVARNYLRDERKSAHQQRTVPLDRQMMSEGHPADPGASPEGCALNEERDSRLRKAIQELPRQQRECILLRSAGLRYREIAEVLGINTNSVGAIVQRAIARLNELLS